MKSNTKNNTKNNAKNNAVWELRDFLILWATQAVSFLGTSMTSFALIIWSYETYGSALVTALISVCSYTPYVLLSMFAGALSDKWNKKYVILICDSAAAVGTAVILFMVWTESLRIWHLYLINGFNGFMNTFQKPASDVAVSLVTPKKYYQKAGGLMTLSSSMVNILTPSLGTALLALAGMETVLLFDLAAFAVASFSLAVFIKLPEKEEQNAQKETVLDSVGQGLGFLKENRGILDLILFLAAVNFIAAIYQAALPAMVLSREGGGETALGIVNTVTGTALLMGSFLASVLPAPRSRVRVICNSLLLAMSTENFFLAFGRTVPVWCFGAILGWLMIPMMNANMDTLLRLHIPISMQGRVYAARNTVQFFTIPLGTLAGGILVDRFLEPWMASRPQESIWIKMFGTGKGSGAAFLFFLIAFAGMGICLIFRKDRHIWALESEPVKTGNI